MDDSLPATKVKTCNSCNLSKMSSEFAKSSSCKDGLQYKCRECDKKYHLANHEKRRRQRREWWIFNKSSVQSKRTKRHRQRYHEDLNYKLACLIRDRVRVALRSKSLRGSASAIDKLGCTIPELKVRLESMFKPGMTWANHSKSGWHIDHIRPLVSFDLSDPEQQQQACHYTNLQPLWAAENFSKKDRV